jgi:hypothetical protein
MVGEVGKGTGYVRKIALASIGSGLVLAIVLLGLGFGNWGAGVLAGDLWAVGNLYCVRFVLQRVLVTEDERRAHPSPFGLLFGLSVKFPLLYGLGYLMLRSGWFRTEGLVIGLIVPFAVAFADALAQFAAERRQAAAS